MSGLYYYIIIDQIITNFTPCQVFIFVPLLILAGLLSCLYLSYSFLMAKSQKYLFRKRRFTTDDKAKITITKKIFFK